MSFYKTEREQDLTTVVRTQPTEANWGFGVVAVFTWETLWLDIDGHRQPEQEEGRDQRDSLINSIRSPVSHSTLCGDTGTTELLQSKTKGCSFSCDLLSA